MAALALIYGSLYFVRAPVEALRELNLLRVTVLAVFVGAAAPLTVWVWRRRPGRRELLVLATSVLLFGVVLAATERPEERLHYLQYGIVAGFFYSALLERRARAAEGSAARPRLLARRPATWALVLTAAGGWADEGIQELLPNRVYDLRDVGLNVIAGVLAIAAMAAVAAARRRDRAPSA